MSDTKTAVDDAAKVLADNLPGNDAFYLRNVVAEALAAAGLLRDGETRSEWTLMRGGLQIIEPQSHARWSEHQTLAEAAALWYPGAVVASRERTTYTDRVTEWKPVES